MSGQEVTPQDPDVGEDPSQRAFIHVESYFVLRLSSSLYGLPASDVQHVAPFAEPVPVPGTPPVFLGVVYLRSRILAAVDLGALLHASGGKSRGADAARAEALRRYVVLHGRGEPFAALVDGVVGIRAIDSNAIRGGASDDARQVTVNGVDLSRGFCDLLDGPATLLCPAAVRRVLAGMSD